MRLARRRGGGSAHHLVELLGASEEDAGFSLEQVQLL